MKKTLFFILFLNFTISWNALSTKYIGKKIKEHKSPIKNTIAEKIDTNIGSLFHSMTDQKSSLDVSDLSASALSRYCGKTYYIQSSNLDQTIIGEKTYDNNICQKDNSLLFYFLNKNLSRIKMKIDQLYPQANQFQKQYYLLLFINKILQGEPSRTIQKEMIPLPLHLSEFDITALLVYKKKFITSDKQDLFDQKAENLLLQTFIFNDTDKVEKDRVSNRITYVGQRNPLMLIITKYDKSTFTPQECLNTFGEMTPSRDIYQKLLFTPATSYYNVTEGTYQMLHRNIPDKKYTNISYALAIPEIHDNMVTYYIFENSNTIKLNEYIKNFNNDQMIIISALQFKQLQWCLL